MAWYWCGLAPSLMLLGVLNSHFALLSTLSDWAYFSSSYFIAYNLLYIHSISFFQTSGMLPVFVFSIWDLDVQKCYKIEDVLYQHKSFEKIPLQQSQFNWFSHLRNRCPWEKSHTHFNKNYTSFWSLIYFWQRFGWKLSYFLNGAWLKIITNKRRAGFISICISNSITIFEIKSLV